VKGIGKARIFREKETGIPHIIGDNDKTAMFGLGYVHA